MAMYFTDRETGPQPRNVDIIDQRVWGGIYALISNRLNDDSFGHRFPFQCPDGRGPCGCDQRMFELTASAEIPKIEWPLSPSAIPATPTIMDLLEFSASAVGEPVQGSWHSFFAHYHLSWDRDAGLMRFVQDVNRLFARNGIAFEMTVDGTAQRLLPKPLEDALANAIFRTGDAETDRLLHAAHKLICSPDIDKRQDALEKLWDAFERLKTLEPGVDKKRQSEALLDRATGPTTPGMRALLGEEAKALTDIGNRFRIRHSEAAQEMLAGPNQIDYLFHRMYAFIRLILKVTNRGG